MTTFIHLPEKKTLNIDWEDSLTKFLNQTFGKSFTNEILKSIQTLDKLRVDIQHSNISDGETLIPIYLNYITQLNSLELRLPMNSVIAGNELEFNWTDAFDSKNKSVKQHSLSFEKASILFSLASLYTYLGAISSSSMDWKNAVINFASSSGILEFISINFLHAPTNDLKVDTTKGLSKLMIAQAQECFLWNYMQSDNIKHSLVSRLSEGTSKSYSNASDLLNKSKSKLDCNDEVHFKSLYFHSFALFHYAQSFTESNKFGYAIVSANSAKDTFFESRRFIGSVGKNKIEPGIIKLNETLFEEIEEKLKEWEKDNDLIYHQALPEKNNIPTIKSMDGSKPISFEIQIKNSNLKDLFEKIVPMEAHQGMSIYSEKQAQVTREWSEKIQIADEKIKSLFEFSRLPDSVVEIQNILRTSNSVIEEEAREKEDKYPKVLAMAHELESSSKLSSDFEQTMQNIQNKRDTIMKQTDDADSWLLKDEKNVIIKGLPQNSELLKLKEEIIMIKNTLSEASNTDNDLNNMWNRFKLEISVLKNGTEEVQKWLSESENSTNKLARQVSLLDIDDSNSNNDAFDMKVAQHLIESIYSLKKSLELLMKERGTTLSDLKTAMHSEDISSILINHSGASESELDEVFNEQLAKYSSYTSRLEALIDVQDDKIIELKDALNRLLDLNIVKKKVEEKKKERSTIKAKLLKLISAYETNKLCSKGVEEAYTFYVKLGDRTTYTVGRIYDIVTQRDSVNTEPRRSISSAMNTGFGGHTVNNYNQQYPYLSQQTQQQQQIPPPVYSNVAYPNVNLNNNMTGYNNRSESVSSAGGAPPLPSKPNTTGSSQPYSTPSVYNPNMYSQFGQNWK